MLDRQPAVALDGAHAGQLLGRTLCGEQCLSEYSCDCLRQWRTDAGVSYDERSGGTLRLFRSQAQHDAAQRDVEVLQACGVPFELLDRAGVARVEPGLARATVPYSGGCHRFTTELAQRVQGVQLDNGEVLQADPMRCPWDWTFRRTRSRAIR